MRIRTVLIAVVAAILVPRVALGVPTLQLYSPQATYDTSTETWVTSADPFELWLVGARTPELIDMTDQLRVFVAIPGFPGGFNWAASPLNPSLTIQTTVSADPVAVGNPDKNPLAPWSKTYTETDLTFGRPASLNVFKGGGLPWHGIYPAWYWTIDLTANAPELHFAAGGSPVFLDVDDNLEKAYDFTAGFDPPNPAASGVDNYGDVEYYLISYSPYEVGFSLHFDLIGYAHDGWAKWKFAPFSHDAEAVPTPEPATVTLLLIGAAGVGLSALRQRRKQCA
jgi:hypothetical protein